jgi:hydrogenase maturation protease
LNGSGEGEETESYDGKTVVVCLGNPYMKDDGLGPEVYRRLRGMALGQDVIVTEFRSLELGTLWQFRSARRLLVVDALKSGSTPGTVSKYSLLPGSAAQARLPDSHGLELGDAMDVIGSEGPSLPVTIIGVESKDCGFGEGLTKEVAAAVPEAVEAILAELA